LDASERKQDSPWWTSNEATSEEVERRRRYVDKLKELSSAIVSGFQIASGAGPLCEEPMMGVCFFVEDVVFKESALGELDMSGGVSGQIITAVKEGCRKAFMEAGKVRIMEPVYKCDVQATSEVLGKTYAVLSRRRAKILAEEMREGTADLFSINALLPVVESFGFAPEMLTKTQGVALTQLQFGGWEIVEVDPFFVPTTEEEMEEHGDGTFGEKVNLAAKLIDDVRKRKGLVLLQQKSLKNPDKQRTLKRNK